MTNKISSSKYNKKYREKKRKSKEKVVLVMAAKSNRVTVRLQRKTPLQMHKHSLIQSDRVC